MNNARLRMGMVVEVTAVTEELFQMGQVKPAPLVAGALLYGFLMGVEKIIQIGDAPAYRFGRRGLRALVERIDRALPQYAKAVQHSIVQALQVPSLIQGWHPFGTLVLTKDRGTLPISKEVERRVLDRVLRRAATNAAHLFAALNGKEPVRHEITRPPVLVAEHCELEGEGAALYARDVPQVVARTADVLQRPECEYAPGQPRNETVDRLMGEYRNACQQLAATPHEFHLIGVAGSALLQAFAAQNPEAHVLLAEVNVLQISEAVTEAAFSRVRGAGDEQSQRMQSPESIDQRAQLAQTERHLGAYVMGKIISTLGAPLARKSHFGREALGVLGGLCSYGIGAAPNNVDTDGSLGYLIERLINCREEYAWLLEAPQLVAATMAEMEYQAAKDVVRAFTASYRQYTQLGPLMLLAEPRVWQWFWRDLLVAGELLAGDIFAAEGLWQLSHRFELEAHFPVLQGCFEAREQVVRAFMPAVLAAAAERGLPPLQFLAEVIVAGQGPFDARAVAFSVPVPVVLRILTQAQAVLTRPVYGPPQDPGPVQAFVPAEIVDAALAALPPARELETAFPEPAEA